MIAAKERIFVSHAINIRLSATLSERLREISYLTRIKKQPLLRDAIATFLVAYEKSPSRDQKKMCERLDGIAFYREPRATTVEKVVLDPVIDGMLRWVAFECKSSFQVIANVALEDYISRLPKPKARRVH